MDPNIQSILLGLFVNGLTAFIAQFGHKDSKLLLGKKLLEKIKWEETALLPVIQKAAKTVAENIEWQGIPTVEIVCLFLRSPEAEAIVRQIYAAKLLTKKEENYSLTSIKKEFLTSFYLFTTAYSSYSELKEDQLEASSYILFDSLIDGCEEALNEAIDEGKLSAHEAKSTFRHRVILDEIAALNENLTFLTSQQKPNLKDILKFEETYRRQVGERYKFITPPNFDKARKFHIDRLYIIPGFAPNPSENQVAEAFKSSPQTDSYSKVLKETFRFVLLGNPGGGKSTFTHKLCYDLANQYPRRFFAGRQGLTPIYVVLRDYGAEKKARNCSILDFIKIKANEDYQIEPPVGAFEYLLLNGRAMVIFDGLDELLETVHRQEVSNAVESFCTAYPSVPVLVTSREIGYEQAPLDEERFEAFHLAPFSENQVKEYVKKWFNTIGDLSTSQKERKVEAFLLESLIVPDLQSNPLMLALLCNIYQEENFIPKNRPDVFERCAMMLFERWDTSRGIKAILPFESQIRPAMMYIAYWIYSQEKLRSGVTEDQLVEKTTEYLHKKLYEDSDEARNAARDFISFCKGRAWVFTNMGSTKNEELYQFTHQTFLEYFTAAYLFRTHSTPSSLFNALRSKIAKREWDVVAQLAFQIQNKQIEGAGDKLLMALLKEASNSQESNRWNLISFAVRCLNFIIPSPKTLQQITSDSIAFALAWGMDRGTSSQKNDVAIDEIIFNLLVAASENRKTIANQIEKVVIERVNNANDKEASLALELGASLGTILEFHKLIEHSMVATDDLRNFWGSIFTRILNGCTTRIEDSCQKSSILTLLIYGDSKDVIDKLIKWHSADSIFRDAKYTFRPSVRRISIADQIIRNLTRTSPKDDMEEIHGIKKSFELIRELGDKLLTCPTPWNNSGKAPFGLPRENLFQFPFPTRVLKHLNEDKSLYFGMFILYAVQSESDDPSLTKRIKDLGTREIKRTEEFIPFKILFLLEARKYTIEDSIIQEVISSCGFTSTQEEFTWKWLRKQISLTTKGVPNRKTVGI